MKPRGDIRLKYLEIGIESFNIRLVIDIEIDIESFVGLMRKF